MSRRLGVEISTTAVRIAEVVSGGGRPRLLSLTHVRMPAGAVVDGAIADPDAVRAAITRCKDEASLGLRARFGPPPVRLSVAGLQAIMREIEMPPVPPDEVDAAVKLQALDIIPFPAEKTLMSARPLGAVLDENGNEQLRVLLAAAHRDLVEPYIDAVRGAGLDPVGVDLAASVLVRALYDPSRAEEGPEAIVSVGADLTTVVVHELGDPLFVRTIAEGGNAVTRSIAAAFDLPLSEAENLKRHLSLDSGQLPAEALHAAREGSARLLSEIRSSIDYFAALPGRSEVRRVLLTGGGSQLAELGERLQLQLIAPVELGSVFEHVDVSDIGADLRPHDPQDVSCAVAIGLAMAPPDGVKELDLLPSEVASRRRQRKIESNVVAVAALVVLVLLATATMRFLDLRSAQQSVAAAQASLARLNAEIPRYAGVQTRYGQLLADERIADPIVSSEMNWPAILADLRRDTPSGIAATSVSGSTTPPAGAPTPAASSAPAALDSLPAASAILGSVSVSLTADRNYPAFEIWTQKIQSTADFQIYSPSGVTRSGPSLVTWSATLAVTGRVHTGRLGEYYVSLNPRRKPVSKGVKR